MEEATLGEPRQEAWLLPRSCVQHEIHEKSSSFSLYFYTYMPSVLRSSRAIQFSLPHSRTEFTLCLPRDARDLRRLTLEFKAGVVEYVRSGAQRPWYVHRLESTTGLRWKHGRPRPEMAEWAAAMASEPLFQLDRTLDGLKKALVLPLSVRRWFVQSCTPEWYQAHARSTQFKEAGGHIKLQQDVQKAMTTARLQSPFASYPPAPQVRNDELVHKHV